MNRDDEVNDGCEHENRKRNSTTGELYCRDCGEVLESERIEEDEVRAYSTEDAEKKKRTGRGISYSSSRMGFGSKLGSGSMEVRSRANRPSKYYRMSKWNNRSHGRFNRVIADVKRQSLGLCEELGLPSSKITEEVCRLFKKSQREDVTKGRKQEILVAALVYAVAHIQNHPRTLREVSSHVDESKRVLGQYYKYVSKELDIEPKLMRPQDLVPRLLSRLEVEGYDGKITSFLSEVNERQLFLGKSPSSVAAGAIYYVLQDEGEDISQIDVAHKSSVTEVTLRKVFRRLEDEFGEVDNR